MLLKKIALGRKLVTLCCSELLETKEWKLINFPGWNLIICLKICYFVTWTFGMPSKVKAESKIIWKTKNFINISRQTLAGSFWYLTSFCTHCPDTRFVGTTLGVMRTQLLHRNFTNFASGELILSMWIKFCFFTSQSFIFCSAFVHHFLRDSLCMARHVSGIITVPNAFSHFLHTILLPTIPAEPQLF